MITERDKANQKAYKSFVQNLSIESQPEYFVTLTLSNLYSDRAALEAFTFFMKSIQKALRLKEGVRGIAFIERTWKNSRFEGQPHIHALLWGLNKKFNHPMTNELFNLATKAASRLKGSRNEKMARLGTLDVQKVYGEDAISSYVAKDMTRWSIDRRPAVYLVTEHGLDTDSPLH